MEHIKLVILMTKHRLHSLKNRRPLYQKSVRDNDTNVVIVLSQS
jgi:hypothetical protein